MLHEKYPRPGRRGRIARNSGVGNRRGLAGGVRVAVDAAAIFVRCISRDRAVGDSRRT